MEAVFALGLVAIVLGLAFASWGADDSDRSAHSKPVARPPARPDHTAKRTPANRPAPKPARPWQVDSHAPGQTAPAARGSTLRGRAYIIDGDTIAIKRTKIRLAGIDAPEIDQPYGQKSKWEMVRICKGQEITVVMHGETSYDRQVGTCYLPDGRDIGAELVKQGLALDLACFSGGKYRGLEPDGARRKLRYGQFGHRSLKTPVRGSATKVRG
jgi:endonuclease YncB( thermonuclease family)